MRIVVLDGHTLNPGDNPWTALENLGEFTVYDRTPAGEVVNRAKGAEVILVNKVRLTRDVLAALPDLKYIGVLATGYDVVDISAAAERGIPVCNIPAYGSQAVAQHVFAMFLALCRRVEAHAAGVALGRWGRAEDWTYWDFPQVGFAGKTMGIVGFGAIGGHVGKIASAFGMDVMGYTQGPRRDPGFAPFRYVDSVEEIFGQADFITLHCPLTPENRGFVDSGMLGRMKPSAYLVNTARGPLINEKDLATALTTHSIAGAGLDVMAVEPPDNDNPLLSLPNCLITPHVAWAALEARKNLMNTAAENVAAWAAGTPQNVVNGV